MLTLSLLIIMTTTPMTAPPTTAIRCELSADSPQNAADPVEVQFALINEGDEDLHVLVWGTPFEGWLGKVFTVAQGGEDLPYQGPLVKRFAPQKDEFLLLPASGELREMANLSRVYSFEAGSYQVTFQGTLHDVVPKGQPVPSPSNQPRPMRVECETLELHLE